MTFSTKKSIGNTRNHRSNGFLSGSSPVFGSKRSKAATLDSLSSPPSRKQENAYTSVNESLESELKSDIQRDFFTDMQAYRPQTDECKIEKLKIDL
eukprot:Awhi_evm1s7524